MRIGMVVVAMLMASCAFAGDITGEATFLDESWHLLAEAQYGMSDREHAAFIVRDADGSLSFREWPYASESRQATFHGAIPPGTVAIIHTHPNAIPVPTQPDSELAKRLHLPVYVLTRTRVTRTSGGAAETVFVGDWHRKM